MQVVVQTEPGNWEDSRKIGMTLALKGKMFITDPENENKTLVVLPRSIDLTALKILKGDDEQFLE